MEASNHSKGLPSWIILFFVAMTTNAMGDVPLETKQEQDDNVSTFLNGDNNDLRMSIKVSHPDSSVQEAKTSKQHTFPWTTQKYQEVNRPGGHSTSQELATFDTTPRPQPASNTNIHGSVFDLEDQSGLREDWTTSQVAPDDFNIPEDKEELKDLVQGLKDQLMESNMVQIATRSILNVVQEKQLALEDDLSYLKNEISGLHRQQTKDRETLQGLKDIVSDNTWGINSLVTSQEHLKKDVHSLKQEQDHRNSTYSQLEEVILLGFKKDEDFHGSLQVLQKEIADFREEWHRDHEAINTLWEMVLGGGGSDYDDEDEDGDKSSNQTKPGKKKGHGHGRRHEKHHNQINPEDLDNGDEHSNQITDNVLLPDLGKLEQMSSHLEDKHEDVRRELDELSRRESQLKIEMETFLQKFATYDMELSRVYAMFYNLSFQMSTLENKLLHMQQRGYENNLAELQHSLLNFTHQVYSLEKMHGNLRGNLNSTGLRNQQDIEMVSNMIGDLQSRLETLEKMSHEQKSNQEVVNNLVRMQISKLNNSVARFYKSFQEHHIEATDVFDFIEEKFMEFNRRIKDNDNRLLQVEVRVLNTSLGHCESQNGAMQQEKTLSDMDRRTNMLKKKVDNHNNMIDRLDHGMTRIFEDFGKQTKVMDTIKNEISTIADIVPQVVTLQHEVSNIMMHLPKDCSELARQDENAISGPHLIRPKGGPTSADAYCEIGPDETDTWTVIQRRTDGSVSFARDWSDYKFGFGSASNEFWLGNDNIHYLTTQDNYMIRIEMLDLQDRIWWAEYSEFRVDEEGDNYRLHISGYSGNATDALRYSNYMPFSTIDKDNDVSSTHCARFYTSGWWYKHCHYGNLNGRYTVGVVWFNHDSDEWMQLKRTVMKVRRVMRMEKKDDNSTKNAKNLENETSESKFIDYYLSNS